MSAQPHRDIIDRFYATVKDHTRPDAVVAQASNFGVRYDAAAFDTSLAEGYGGSYEMTLPTSDQVFSRGDIYFYGQARQKLLGEELLRIRLSLVGEGRFEGVTESSPSSFSGQACFIIDQAAGSQVAQVTDSDSRHCGVTLLLPRHLLSSVWQFDTQLLPPIFRNFEQQDTREPRALVMELTAELAVVATEIMQCRLSGPLLTLYLDGKAREIVSLLADQLSKAGAAESVSVDLNQRDVKLLYDAHDIIKKQYITPTSIDDLAHQVGLNRNKLCYGFKQLFGSPIFEYCRELRLQQAMRLLKEGDTPLVDIALQIGFKHAPAFSTAFKKRFGCSPKQFRRSGSVLPDTVTE